MKFSTEIGYDQQAAFEWVKKGLIEKLKWLIRGGRSQKDNRIWNKMESKK